VLSYVLKGQASPNPVDSVYKVILARISTWTEKLTSVGDRAQQALSAVKVSEASAVAAWRNINYMVRIGWSLAMDPVTQASQLAS